MRLALASRDLTTVYRRLQRIGVSQRRIAALTGQSPSEVYEILNGRQVMAYDVLLRIADGLGLPRGYLGLSYDNSTIRTLQLDRTGSDEELPEAEDVRRLLAHAAQLTMGAPRLDEATWWQPVEHEATPIPQQIGMSDVEKVRAITAVMRALDYRYGGGACRDAVLGHSIWAQQLLGARCSAAVATALHVALADLHNLAGWISFDVGLSTAARRHFARALEQAQRADNPSLVANVLYRMGRLHLHRGWHRDALRFFQLGQLAAQDSGCELTVSVLCANEAWAYAVMGDEARALKSLLRAEDEFGRADEANAAPWVRFFGVADLQALTGMTHIALHSAGRGQLDTAIDALHHCLSLRGPEMARSRVFELAALATAHILAGNVEHAMRAGGEALATAEAVRSVRTLDRLEPLQRAAGEPRTRHADLRDLAERIATLRAR